MKSNLNSSSRHLLLISGLTAVHISSFKERFFFDSCPKNAYEFLTKRLSQLGSGRELSVPDCSCYLGQKLEGKASESWLNIF